MFSRMDLSLLLAAFTSFLAAVLLWVAEQSSGVLLSTWIMSILSLSVGVHLLYSISQAERRPAVNRLRVYLERCPKRDVYGGRTTKC
jgi:NAD/NADP transhydrogenase beta subunit